MKPKVLIVDDEPEFAELLEFNLRKQGCDTIRAENGIQGLRLARAEMPDVILLDIMLPDLDGLSVCDILQSQPSTRGLPVFMLSALDETYARRRCSRSKFDLYFTKPVDLALLGSSVRRAAQARQESVAAGLRDREQ